MASLQPPGRLFTNPETEGEKEIERKEETARESTVRERHWSPSHERWLSNGHFKMTLVLVRKPLCSSLLSFVLLFCVSFTSSRSPPCVSLLSVYVPLQDNFVCVIKMN